jgi:hypothetical protein
MSEEFLHRKNIDYKYLFHGHGTQNFKLILKWWKVPSSLNVVVVSSVITVDFTKLWPRQLRGWLGIWDL